MNCPVCGAENPDGSKYCSKCLTNLVMATGEYQQAGDVYGGQSGHAPSPYVPPSEWRGRAGSTRQDLARKISERSHHQRVEWAVYGGIILFLVVLLILAITIWGNKSPAQVANGFIQALNNKDIEGMKQYVDASGGPLQDEKLQSLIEDIGPEGAFVNLSYTTDEQDYYAANVRLQGGTYAPGGTSLDVEITPAENLYIGLENQKGRWYVDLNRINIFP
jgi:uncharacterized membrane protein YvbJ